MKTAEQLHRRLSSLWRRRRPRLSPRRAYKWNTTLHRYEEDVVLNKLARLSVEHTTPVLIFDVDTLIKHYPGVFNRKMLHGVLRRMKRRGLIVGAGSWGRPTLYEFRAEREEAVAA